MTQRVLLVINPRSVDAVAMISKLLTPLIDAGIEVLVTADDLDAISAHGIAAATSHVTGVKADEHAADSVDVVVVLGGDGTVLRAAELARSSGTPLLGVNLGHVGFLAEAESDAISAVVDAIVHGRWDVEERTTLDVRIHRNGELVSSTWALNEIALEKRNRERIIDIVVEVDGRPLSRWGCDGVVCATPTGSTAYAFSAGGPVVWPEVSAMLVVPLSAHALFARPLVVSPTSVVAFELNADAATLLSADGRRLIDVAGDSRVEVRQHPQPVRFARLNRAPFTDRLVAKFQLPVDGWRGRRPESG